MSLAELVDMLRVIIGCLLVASTAHADVTLALTTGPMWRSSTLDAYATEQRELPGPGASVDVISARDGWSVGAHFGWSSGFNRKVQPGTPSDLRSFDSLLQLHVLVQYRDSGFAIGAGVGHDVAIKYAHYADPVSSTISPQQVDWFSSTDNALGGHVQASYDLGSIERGTFGVYAGAGLFHIFHPADLCAGECTAPHQGQALWVGVMFRPR
jgi:hypothetical protein